MDDQNKKSICNPIMNGYVCPITNEQLDYLQSSLGLNAKIEKDNLKSNVIFTDRKGNWIATAVKIGDSDTKLFAKKKIL